MNEIILCFFTILLFKVILGNINDGKLQSNSQYVRCLLLENHQDPCIIIGGSPVPEHLIKVFISLPENVKKVIKSNTLLHKNTAGLTFDEFKSIPKTFWFLTPVERLSHFSGKDLSSIILSFPNDTSIAAQTVSSLRTPEQRNSFLISLSMKFNLSEKVQDVIAEAVSTWKLDRDWNFIRVVFVGSPLLAHFPPHFLFANPSSITRFSFFLKTWDNMSDPVWLMKPGLIQRIWGNMLAEEYKPLSNWSYVYMERFHYFLPGMLTDHLEDLRKMNDTDSIINRKTLLNLPFDMQKTQLLFDIFYSKEVLTKKHFKAFSHFLIKLSPKQLQKFSINATNFQKNDVILNLDYDNVNFISMKQITQMFIAELKLHGKLKSVNSSHWGSSIGYLGPCVYTIPLHDLLPYSIKPPDAVTLEKIESSKLSFMQIYYLTGNGTAIKANKPSTMRSLKWMLKSFPASDIRNMNVTDVGSSIWLMLFSNLPSDNVPRTIAFIRQFGHLLYDSDVFTIALKRLLKNSSKKDYFQIFPSHFIKHTARKISNNLENFDFHEILNFPASVVSLLLNEYHSKSWLWNDISNSTAVPLQLFIRGLTCYDIQKLETSEFIYVISEYNRERIEANHVFPKNLQHCCFEKLIKYLEMKSQIMQEDLNEGLIMLLEPGDIEAVGGYVLASLPKAVIASSEYRKQILKSIGKLSMPELLLAVSKQQMDDLLKLALTEFMQGEVSNLALFQLGNLTLFLRADDLHHVQPPAFKLFMELDYSDKRLCADRRARLLWSDIVIKAFGKPEHWSQGTIKSLSDFLLVMNEEYLNRINKSMWLRLGESLDLHYGDSIEWWLEDTPFYKACSEVLDKSERGDYLEEVKKLVKWQLKVSQWQLNTVKYANDFIIDYRSTAPHYSKISPSFYKIIDGIRSKIINFNSNIKVTTTDVLLTTLVSEKPNVTITTATDENYPTNKLLEDDNTNNNDNFNYNSSTAKILTDESISSTKGFNNFNNNGNEDLTTVSTINNKPLNNNHSVQKQNRTLVDTIVSIFTLLNSDKSVSKTTTMSTFTSESDSWELTTNFSLYKSDDFMPASTESMVTVKKLTNSTDIEPIIFNTSELNKPENLSSTVTTTMITDFYSTNSPDHIFTSTIFPTSFSSSSDQNIFNETASNINLFNSEDIENNTSAELNIYNDSEVTEIPFSTASTMELSEENVRNITSDMFLNLSTSDLFSLSTTSELTHHTTEFKYPEDLQDDNTDVTTLSEENSTESSPETTTHDNFYDINGAASSNKEFFKKDNETSAENDFFNDEPNSHLILEFSPSAEERFDLFEYYHQNDYNNNDDDSDYHLNIDIDDDNMNKFRYKRDIKNYIEQNYKNSKIYRTNHQVKRRHITQQHNEFKISCDALRIVGSISQLVLDENHINKMSYDDINDCLDVFGNMNLSYKLKKMLWNLTYNNELHLMGSLLEAAEVSDIENINFNFDERWILETVHLFSKFTPEKKSLVQSLVNKVIESNEAERIGPEGLAALSKLICDMKTEDREEILSKSRNISLAAIILGQINDCSTQCLSDLAEYIMSSEYGSPSNWDSLDVMSLGIIPAGLLHKDWIELIMNGKNPLMGLQPSAAKCLPPKYLMAIPAESLHLLPYKTVMVIIRQYYHLLKEDQKHVLSSKLKIHQNITRKLLPVRTEYEINNAVTLFVSHKFILVVTFMILLYVFIDLFMENNLLLNIDLYDY